MSIGNLDYKKKEDIVDFIETLDRLEHFDIIKDIFKLLLHHDVHYTENQNGSYFRVIDLEDKVIDELIKFITFTKNNWKAIRLRQEEIQLVSITSVVEAPQTIEPPQVDNKIIKNTEEVPTKNESNTEAETESFVAKKKKKSYNKTWNQMLKECKTK